MNKTRDIPEFRITNEALCIPKDMIVNVDWEIPEKLHFDCRDELEARLTLSGGQIVTITARIDGTNLKFEFITR